jgi:uncharacterized protein (TIGR00251 family)
MEKWVQKTKDGYLIKVHIVPNSSKTVIVGEHGDRLKIKIKAPPVDGKANEEILEFLCNTLGLKLNQAELVSGLTSKSKNILLKVATLEIEKLKKV